MINLNDNVKVILTETGANIMNEREEYYSNIIPNYRKHKYCAGDELKEQLWCLFKFFGNYIDITCKSPFHNNEIYVRGDEKNGKNVGNTSTQ